MGGLDLPGFCLVLLGQCWFLPGVCLMGLVCAGWLWFLPGGVWFLPGRRRFLPGGVWFLPG